jgi:hypothetical protein
VRHEMRGRWKSGSRRSSAVEPLDPLLGQRQQVVATLAVILGREDPAVEIPPLQLHPSLPAAGKRSSQRHTVVRPVAPVRLSSLLSPRSQSNKRGSLSRTSSSEDSETFSSESQSAVVEQPDTKQRDQVVKWLTAALAKNEDDENARTWEQLVEAAHDEGNVHRERDLVVLCLTNLGAPNAPYKKNRESVSSSSTSRTFGSLSFPQKPVKQFEDSLEERYPGSSASLAGVTRAFLSLWNVEFVLLFLAKCAASESTEIGGKSLLHHVAVLTNAAGLSAQTLCALIAKEIVDESKEASRATMFRSSSLATAFFSAVYLSGSEGLKVSIRVSRFLFFHALFSAASCNGWSTGALGDGFSQRARSGRCGEGAGSDNLVFHGAGAVAKQLLSGVDARGDANDQRGRLRAAGEHDACRGLRFLVCSFLLSWHCESAHVWPRARHAQLGAAAQLSARV